MFDIFYYANTDELNMTSNFKELRSACIRVATNKYGANTAEFRNIVIIHILIHYENS